MRWWLQVDPPHLMSVDNSSVKGMDFSELLADEPDLWMVEWRDGKGELERQDVENDQNLNGLRESFIDIIPYCPLFDQFLTKIQAKNLTLPQAKKVKCDLIAEVFNAKRQAPYHYPVASGDYYWDATDATLFASTVPAIQNAIAKINEIISRLNTQFPALKSIDDQLSARDQSVVGQVNSNVVAPGDTLTTQVNVNVVTQGNSLIGEINGNITNYLNANASTVQAACASGPIIEDGGTSTAVAKPGVGPGAMLSSPGLSSYPFLGVTADFLVLSMAALTTAGWTPMTNVTQTNVMWIPIGHSTPVPVTPAESAAILNGIAARTNDLAAKKATKQAEVNALTTIEDVIDYDVTTGW